MDDFKKYSRKLSSKIMKAPVSSDLIGGCIGLTFTGTETNSGNNSIKALGLFKLVMLSSLFVACSPVQFSKDPSLDKCQNFNQQCIAQAGFDNFNYTVSVGGGKTDILIVDDNSASMSFEQTQLANRFSGFIANLDARGVDYRIAITTTDISGIDKDGFDNVPRLINQNGALQDGGLIRYSDGSVYLTPSNPNRINLFNSAIQRSETRVCEQFIANWASTHQNDFSSDQYKTAYHENCPSNDERGIYAANLVLEKNPSSFLRSDAHTAIIFLSDENERSDGSDWDANWDTAASLVNRFKAKFNSTKTLSAYPIVVSNEACLSLQNSQVLGNPAVYGTLGIAKGSYGTLYKQFSDAGYGPLGDICASDSNYTTQLGNIATSIASKLDSIGIACSSPSNLVVTISTSDNSISWSLTGSTIKFNKSLPAKTNVSLAYQCKTL